MNRLIEFVDYLHSKNIKDWDTILKEQNKKFDSKFRINQEEADYLTRYWKGELNFNTKIIHFNNHKKQTK